MKRALPIFAALLTLFVVSVGAAHADQDTENKLRDALRNALTQSRAMEDERAVLQAKQAESDKQIEDLKAQVETLTKQGGGKKQVDQQSTEELTRRIAEQGVTIGQLNESLAKWEAAYNEAANVARTKEADRAKLAEQTNALTERAKGCEIKNAALFRLGNEILDRYAGMSFGEVLGAREPFIRIMRVELQNVVQDYQDKLLDQRASSR